MQLSDLTIRIIVLFFPGIICSALVDQLTVHRDRSTSLIVVHSLLMGMTCYFTLYLVAALIDFTSSFLRLPVTSRVVFFDALFNHDIKPDWVEIVWATLFAGPLALLFSWISRHNFLHRIAQYIGSTSKFGDLDVWDFMLNSPDIHWLVVRDIKNDLSFYGWAGAFSDTVDKPELLLRDVKVYRNSTGELLHEVGGMYLSRKPEDITIEIADLGYKVPDGNGEKADGQ
jgi:hypothetical protein